MSDDKKKGSKGKNPWGNTKGNTKGNSANKGKATPPPRTASHMNGGQSDIPDIDAMLRKAKGEFDGMIPGNFSGGVMGLIIGAVLLFLFVNFCAFIVKPGEHVVVQRFGAWERTITQEGLNFQFPWPIENVSKVNVNEIRTMNIGFAESFGRGVSQARDIPEESLMLTSDRNIVDIDLVIQWNIKSAEDYVFNIKDQEATIKKVAESAIREKIGQTNMFPIITTERDSVSQATEEILQKNLDEYNSGVNITQILIQRAEVHPDVQEAFQDVQSAKQDAEDFQNRARAYREGIIPKARGAAIQLIQDAQAYEESKVAKATGDAERFNSVYSAYLQGQDVTKKRIYIETMENVLQNAQKIIMDNNGGNQGVVPYLPLNELKPTTSTPAKKSN